jgi:hypothetical protein
VPMKTFSYIINYIILPSELFSMPSPVPFPNEDLFFHFMDNSALDKRGTA